MEQARCWMLTKRKHGLTSHLQASTHSSYDQSSWEEQAFAEDAAGPLGGCIWPPRSYPCSFCRREFRSAQALGGHMNVHRRDRARLKHSPPLDPHNDQNYQNNNNVPFQIPNTSPLGFQYPNSICTLLNNPNPNSDPIVIPSSSSPSSANFEANILFSTTFSSSTKNDQKVSPRSSTSYHHVGPDHTSEGSKNSENLESRCTHDHVSLDIVEEGDEGYCKRRRITASTLLPFFVKANSVDRHHVRSDVFEIGTCSKEELDLELSLGDRPKVK